MKTSFEIWWQIENCTGWILLYVEVWKDKAMVIIAFFKRGIQYFGCALIQSWCLFLSLAYFQTCNLF